MRSFHIVPHWQAYHEAQGHTGTEDTCAECANLGLPDAIPVSKRTMEDVHIIMRLDKRHGDQLKIAYGSPHGFNGYGTQTLAQRRAKAQKRYEKMCQPTPEPVRSVRRRKR